MKALVKISICLALISGCSPDDPSKDPDIPIAKFIFETLDKGVVKFTSRSEFTEEHLWEFGDGKTSSERDPSHTYIKNGEYIVTLTARNPHGSHKVSETLSISDLHPPIADFIFDNKGKGVVEFKSTSTHAKEYEWDFGNGKSSRVANPTHTYESNGTYAVSLTVKNEYGTSSKSQSLVLNNVSLPQANFTFAVDAGKVTFTNTSQFAETYQWNFGNGQTSTAQHPVHTYTENKTYLVKLTAKSGIGENSVEKTVAITGIPVVPQTANNLLYLSNYSDGKQLVQAVDASSGEIRWTKDGLEGRVRGAISLVGGALYFLTENYLYSLDASSGSVRWRFAAGSGASPLVLNNVVYFGSDDGKVYAVNTSNGSRKWERPVGAAVSASVIMHGDVLYVGTLAPAGGGGGTFYALNSGDGSVRWQRGTYGGSMNTRAQVSGNYVYFGGSVGLNVLHKDYGGDIGSGLIAYSFRQVQNSNPIVSENHVFALFGGSEFSRVDVGSDAAIWSQQLGSSGNTANPIMIGNVIFISGQNRVYALNKANGGVNWSFQGTNFNSRNVTYANDIIYAADNKGSSSELVALNAGNGSVIFRKTFTGSLGDMTVLAKDGKVTYPGSTGQN